MELATVEAMLTQMFQEMDADLEYAMRHPDFEADMPQSGEPFASREALRDMQRAYPDPPTITLRRVVGEGDIWVAEATSDYSGQQFHTVLILEMRDDLILRETRYYAEPFEAPAWRAAWVQSIPEEPTDLPIRTTTIHTERRERTAPCRSPPTRTERHQYGTATAGRNPGHLTASTNPGGVPCDHVLRARGCSPP